jgi:hypothetical protein
VTRRSSILTGPAVKARVAAILLVLSLPGLAHEGHDHGAIAQPADAQLAPRFELRSEEIEIVGVLAGKQLFVYLDRAADNAPITGAQIEIEGPEIKGVPVEIAEGVYQLDAASLVHAGQYPLTITVQAGEIVDLLAVSLAVGKTDVAVASDEHSDRRWWRTAFAVLAALTAGGLILRRLRYQPK